MNVRIASIVSLVVTTIALAAGAQQLESRRTRDLDLIYYDKAHEYLSYHLARSFENSLAFHRKLFDYNPSEPVVILKDWLDTKAGAFAELRDGGHALVPGKSSESVLVERITAPDATKRMPPAKFGKQLKPDQIALLTRWLEQGAKWSEHWAFVPPGKPALPIVEMKEWPRNELDYFILQKQEQYGVKPNPEPWLTFTTTSPSLDCRGSNRRPARTGGRR